MRRHFLRNRLGHPSLQKEQKIGDGPLPSAARVRPASATAHYSASLRSARRLPQMTLRPVGCLMFCLRLRYRSDSDKTSGPRATRGSSHSLRFLCSFAVSGVMVSFILGLPGSFAQPLMFFMARVTQGILRFILGNLPKFQTHKV